MRSARRETVPLGLVKDHYTARLKVRGDCAEHGCRVGLKHEHVATDDCADRRGANVAAKTATPARREVNIVIDLSAREIARL